MKGDDIAERLLEFAVAVLRITTRLPADSPGRALQLVNREQKTGKRRTGNEGRRHRRAGSGGHRGRSALRGGERRREPGGLVPSSQFPENGERGMKGDDIARF